MKITANNEAFVRLYAREEGRLRRYVAALVPTPSDVDDILQETAIALMRKFEWLRNAFWHWPHQ